jgi:hypothetical protein
MKRWSLDARSEGPPWPLPLERWVIEFNTATEKLEKSLDIDLHEFKVP